MRRAAFLILGAIAALAWLSPAASAQDDRPEIVRLRVGIGGCYKVGQWTPVEITLRGGNAAMTGGVTLTVPDGDGVPSRVSTPVNRPCQVLPGRDTTVLLFARFGRTDSDAMVRFHVDDKVVAEREYTAAIEADDKHFASAMTTDQRLFVEIGPGSAGVEDAVTLAGRDSMNEPRVVRLSEVDSLPTRWYGYEGVDAVVISTSRPEVFHKLLGGSNARVEALDHWIRMGGKLVLLVGSQGSEILDASGPLARFAPGKLESMTPLHSTEALELYVENAASVAAPGQRVDMLAPRLKDITGEVEARESDLPMIIRAARGFGQVVFVAADLDCPPLNQWKDRKRLMAMLLGVPTKREDVVRENTAIMQMGYEDISGQLRSAMDEFTGVRLVPFAAVVAGILAYIVLVGPVDYFLLRKFRRLEWTWITFPLVVIAFSMAAYFLAYAFKGEELRVNQVDLVDVDVAGGLARGTTWANVFSPRAERYDLRLRPGLPDAKAADDAEVLLSWLGLPGEGLGGMNAATATTSAWRRAYDFSSGLDTIEGVPIQVWSTKSFTGRWSGQWKNPIEANLTRKDDVPTGRITNTLGFAMEDCLLVYDRWVYQLGTMAAGESARFDSGTQRVELKTLLTGRKMMMDAKGDHVEPQPAPYDVASKQIPYILRMMMFFDAAGGSSYTRLSHRYQPFVDFSELLGPDRAILVGVGPAADHPGAELLRDRSPLGGEGNRRVTMYRFMVPVGR